MMRCKPGQSVRSSLTSSVLGVLTDPSSPIVTVRLPDGSTLTPAPTRDATGAWHADFVIPSTIMIGSRIGVVRWQSSGAAADQNAIHEERFEVVPLDF